MKAIIAKDEDTYLVKLYFENGDLFETYVVSDIIIEDLEKLAGGGLAEIATIHELPFLELVRRILKDAVKNYKKGRRPAYLRKEI